MRRVDDLVAFVREVLERDAREFHGLRVQVELGRVDEQHGAAQVMVVVVFLDVGEVAHEGHLDGALGACAHAVDVAFEPVVLVDDLEGRRLEEGLEGRDGDVEFHANAREQRLEHLVHVVVETLDFGGLVLAVGAQHLAETAEDVVELAAESPFERLEDFVQELGEYAVAFEVPDGDGFGEHAPEGVTEFFRRARPFLALLVPVVARGEYPHLGVFGIFAGDALHLLDAEPFGAKERLDLGGLLFAQAVEDGFGDAFENSFDFDGLVRVVEERNVERELGQEPADAHQDVRLSGVVVADEGGESAQRECLPLDGTKVANRNL